MEEITNKVQQSGLISINLEELFPKGERVEYDLAQNLWQGLALKEKDFREFIQQNDWKFYQDKFVAIHCSVDAIVPTWAYMLLSSAIQPYAKKIVYGNLEHLERVLFHELVSSIDEKKYEGATVVIKGSGDLPVPNSAFVDLTNKLLPVVKSLMFGEPCSTVPIYKKK
jgi:hypothetical protein